MASTLLSVPGRMLWRMPLSFQIANVAGPAYSLRCLVFHDIADEVSRFTKGIAVTTRTADFEARIRFISQHYSPMSLQDYLDRRQSDRLPSRPAIVTFDDAYASVALNAAPILSRYKIPAVFFVTASLVGNQELGLDNLICYVANTAGPPAVCLLANQFVRRDSGFTTIEQVFDDLLPVLSQEEIRRFRGTLTVAAGGSAGAIAQRAQLYVNAEQLQSLAKSGFEIGSHTFSHVFCRSLADGDFEREIDANKEKLEAITGLRVRAFSVPYGSPTDLTSELAQRLRRSGHEVVFLARDRSNSFSTDLFHLDRINVHAENDGDFFGEIEVLPRIRSVADILLRRRP